MGQTGRKSAVDAAGCERMKPILFNTDMVRAILDGRKTVTRRVVKPQPRMVYYDGRLQDSGEDTRECSPLYVLIAENHNGAVMQIVPPCQPGQTLYVRETWGVKSYGTPGGMAGKYVYKADGGECQKWRPSIHMPRAAARLFLRVTDVRVERLRDITEEQAIAEGVRIGLGGEPYFSCRNAFQALWDSTIKPADRERYGWDANPWVWVIAFKRVEREDVMNDDAL